MKKCLVLIFFLCAVVSATLWLLPNPWALAGAKAAQDAVLLNNLIKRPDRLLMRLAEDTSLKNAVIWDADGVLQHPVPKNFNHVWFELSEKEIRRLTRYQQQASPVLWMPLEPGSEIVARCSSQPSICLIYNLDELRSTIGLGWQTLTIPNRRSFWLVLAITMTALFGLAAFWPNRKLKRDDTSGFSFLPEHHTARWGGFEISLTPRDVKLLALLEARNGVVVTKDELYDAGWGRNYMPNSRALEQHMINLRRKLDPDKSRPELIETVHGVGYRLCG